MSECLAYLKKAEGIIKPLLSKPLFCLLPFCWLMFFLKTTPTSFAPMRQSSCTPRLLTTWAFSTRSSYLAFPILSLFPTFFLIAKKIHGKHGATPTRRCVSKSVKQLLPLRFQFFLPRSFICSASCP